MMKSILRAYKEAKYFCRDSDNAERSARLMNFELYEEMVENTKLLALGVCQISFVNLCSKARERERKILKPIFVN